MPEQSNEQSAEEQERQQHASGCDCPWCAMREHMGRWSESEAWQHFSKAHEEFLQGVKALIEHRLDDLKSRPKPEGPRVTKIKVE
jgi:hypothetical protein